VSEISEWYAVTCRQGEAMSILPQGLALTGTVGEISQPARSFTFGRLLCVHISNACDASASTRELSDLAAALKMEGGRWRD